MQVVRQQLSHYSGPLPQAEQMEHYERICPGYARELLEMAKKAQDHAQDMDKKTIEIHQNFMARHQTYFGRGQIIGGILAFSAIAAGTIFAIYGAPVTGASLIGGVMAVLAGAFAWGKWHENTSGDSSGIMESADESD